MNSSSFMKITRAVLTICFLLVLGFGPMMAFGQQGGSKTPTQDGKVTLQTTVMDGSLFLYVGGKRSIVGHGNPDPQDQSFAIFHGYVRDLLNGQNNFFSGNARDKWEQISPAAEDDCAHESAMYRSNDNNESNPQVYLLDGKNRVKGWSQVDPRSAPRARNDDVRKKGLEALRSSACPGRQELYPFKSETDTEVIDPDGSYYKMSNGIFELRTVYRGAYEDTSPNFSPKSQGYQIK